MKKILSYICLVLLLNNMFVYNAFAGLQIDFQLFQIKVNNGTTYAGDIEVTPGSLLSFMLSGQNKSDEAIINPQIEFEFSNNNFYYNNVGLNTYINSTVINQNIPTTTFKPGEIDILPLGTTAQANQYLDAYFLNITLKSDIPDTLLTINSKISADGVESNQISRNVYINSRPHIIDYYFEKSGQKVTQLSRGGENVDLIFKIKDYNGCTNIDGGIVTANLGKLGMNSGEPLSYVGCEGGNVAIFKRGGISTIILPTSINFTYNDFVVIDESGNENLPNDSLTSFDNEDMKNSISLEIASAGVPNVSLDIGDDSIGGISNLTSSLKFLGNQNGDYKMILGTDGTCASGTILSDWSTYLANSDQYYVLNSDQLDIGLNNITVCLKNDENLVGTFSSVIYRDETAPEISTVSVGPANVVLEDSVVHFTCGEKGSFRVEKGGSGVADSGVLIGNGNVEENLLNDYVINNGDIDVHSNDFYIYCFDEAQNYTSFKININKTTPPPSFVGNVSNFSDNDVDYDGLDGRDIFVEWDNTSGINYEFFEAYLVYVLPVGTELDYQNHNYMVYDTNVNSNSFLGSGTLKNDSAGNLLVSNTEYKVCVSIIGTNGVKGDADCSKKAILIGDVVNHATIIGAKFKTDTILEITTDTSLDANLLNHNAGLISFTYNGVSIIGSGVSSVDGNKINIIIPSLGNTSAVGSNLLLGTGAIRSNGGGFNNNQTFLNISDGQTPLISEVSCTTSPIYNIFYNGNINIGYKFSENMKSGVTQVEVLRTSGNTDSQNHSNFILNDNLLSGNHTKVLNLDSMGLVSGTNYQLRVTGSDLSSNYNASNYIFNIGYDNIGPNKVTQVIVPLYSTLTPELKWYIPLDNNGNGSGIKNYTIDIYNGKGCVGSINQTNTVASNSYVINSVGNIADYSWKVVAIDNVGNIGTQSDCNNFRVDTSVPYYSNLEIKDLTSNTTDYIKNSHNIEITSNITNTDINHIWLDLSMITGSSSNGNELCASPSSGITCSYIGGVVRYELNVGNISDGTKQVQFNAQNTSGGNDEQKIVSIISDSNPPIIASNAILSPVGLVGGEFVNIKWNPSKITDTIFLDHVEVKYSKGGINWNNLYSGVNIGEYDWNLTSIVSGEDYKIRLVAYDKAGNTSNLDSDFFEIDNTNPSVSSNTIISPDGGEVFGGSGVKTITWNSGNIYDKSLETNPISLYYSIDGGSNWILIAQNIANNGIYDWSHGNLNSQSVLIKLVAVDKVGNHSSDISNGVFSIDTLKPSLNIDFVSTPDNGSYINNSGFDILGDTSDVNLDGTYYSLKDDTNGKYFDGNSFSSTQEVFNSICIDSLTGGNTGSCELVNYFFQTNITNGNNYILKIKSEDDAGNQITSSSISYIGDTQNPDLNILTQDNSYFKNSININGTSGDIGAGVSSVKIQIKKGNDYWDGNDFVNSEQTLMTQTTNGYNDWSYDFEYYGDDGNYEVIVLAFDKSFKINNLSTKNITVIKDGTKPDVIGGSEIFASPLNGDLYIGGSPISIYWDSSSISDNGAGLKDNPINLEYFDGIEWKTISENEPNDGIYTWTSELLDSNEVKVRLAIRDKVDNIAYQSSKTFSIDSTPPSISSIETMDLDANGQIDALNVIMSENIRDSGLIEGDFVISDGIGTPKSIETGNAVNDERFILKFDNIGNTSFTPGLSYMSGSIQDIAGKYADTDLDRISIDKAVARLLNSEIYDIDGNGKFDKITGVFSEDMNNSIDITAWNIENAYSSMNIKGANVSGKNFELLLYESLDYNTGVGIMSLDFNSNSYWTDLNNNIAGSIIGLDIIDKAKPIIYRAEYFDDNSNYKVDKVVVKFSENVEQYIDGDFSISGLVKNTSFLSSSVATFSINETSDDNNTGIVSKLSFSGGNLRDAFGNIVESVSEIQIVDRVIPKLLSIETNDNNGNGKIDGVVLNYSEELSNDFSNFIGEIESYNILGYSKLSSNQVIINTSEKSVYDSGDTPEVSVLANNSLSDMNGNLISDFNHISGVDKVGPVIIGARYDQVSQKIYLYSSENIDSSTFINSNIVLNNAGSYTITDTNYTDLSFDIANENIVFGQSIISFVANGVTDLLGNKQSGTNFVELSPPIIINEVMLSNNSDDNYVELKNLSSSDVDISGYKIGSITLPIGSNISGNGYFLITKTSKENSVLNIDGNYTNSNLDISGDNLVLNNGLVDIDFANLTIGLLDTSTPKSMERKNNITNGLLSSSWYMAEYGVGFDNNLVKGTPGTINIFDAISPSITSFSPSDSGVLPNGNFDVKFNYSDNVGGLGINTMSDSISLVKWSGGSWGEDISGSNVDLAGKTITDSMSQYKISNLTYGKYKINFSIADNAGNRVSKTVIVYVDNFSFKISSKKVDLGKLQFGMDNFGENEVIIEIKTIGTEFDVDIFKNNLLSTIGSDIIDYNGTNGFGYERYNGGYYGIITPIINKTNFVHQNKNVNINGEINTYKYYLKYGANINLIQGAGYYSTNTYFDINPTY